MKVAFDCRGTLLDGPEKVHRLFDFFEKKGAEIIVWSSSSAYLGDAKNLVGQDRANFRSKMFKSELRWDPDAGVDVAVDDDENAYLAAKHLIVVHEIPENPSDFESVYGHLFQSNS